MMKRTLLISAALQIFLIACGQPTAPPQTKVEECPGLVPVRPGIEVLVERGFEGLIGRNVGLLTNPSGVDRNLKSTVDILAEAPEVNLKALFAPEHGVRGDVYAGGTVSDATDPVTGCPVYSVYGAHRKPTPQMLKGLDVGEITIASYSSISTHWLPPIIKRFRADYPNISIRLMEGIRQEVKGWLEESRADIGFLSSGSDLSDYEWIPLAKDPMLAVLPRDHPFADHKSYPVLQCVREDFIMPALGRERFQIEPNILFSTLENYAAISMIESGLGMSIMNELITKDFQADVVMLPLDPPQSITLGMAIPSPDTVPPAVRRFAEYVSASIA